MQKTIAKLYKEIGISLRNPFFQACLFLAATIITIILMGYHFGTFDQAIHIPFLKKFSDPSLYQKDGFFDLRFIHYSFFWFFFIPLYRLGILEISMFIVYFITIYLTFWSLWKLSKTIFNNNLVSFITVICFIFPHIGFAGFPLIEFSLLNRTFVLPFLLIAIDQYINKKYYISFIILGLMYNLHVISVNFVLVMFFLDILFRIKTIGVKKIILMFLLFLFTALPVLVWKFGGEGLDFSVNRQWFDIVNKGFLFHLFNLFSSNLMLNILTFSAISLIILFFITIKKQKLTEINQTVIRFVLAAIGVIMAVFITSNLGIYPATIIIQSQIIRIGIFILLFAYLYCINDVVVLYQSKKIKTVSFIFLITVILFSISPAMLLIAYLIYKSLSKNLIRIFIIINTIIFVTALIIGSIINVWYPGININYRKDKQTDVQIWISKNTPKDAVLITPPYTWWFYNVEWRVLTERSNLVSLSDLLEVAFSPKQIKWWKPRFEDIAPGALSQFKDNVFDNIMITKEAYYKLKTEDFLRIAKKYNASYLIVETAYKYNFPIVYKNEEFAVYKINPL